MDHVLEIENLTKDYEVGFWRKKKVRALDGLSLSVDRGQIFGFLGGNGAGKTTTIKMLMGLLFPTSGTARILGRDIADVEVHSRIGYCPENPYFYDYLTASELMNYFGELFGLDPAQRKAKASELLTRVRLGERDWNKQLRRFSKGMLQRVGLAQALINDPEVVFLDEPMSGLDPVGRRDVRDLIANLRSTGTTVFMSTHILSDAETLCDEVAILASGRLAATGKITSLLSENAGPREFEVLVDGLDLEQAKAALGSNSEVRLDPTATGVRALTTKEAGIGDLIGVLTRAGGSFVSATPLKQSLEDIFVARTQSGQDPVTSSRP